MDWLFYKADIRPGLSIGFIVMAAALAGTLIATVSARVIAGVTPKVEPTTNNFYTTNQNLNVNGGTIAHRGTDAISGGGHKEIT